MATWNRVFDWTPPWLLALVLFVLIAVVGLTLHRMLLRWAQRQPPGWHFFLRHVLERTRRLVRYMILLFAAGSGAAQFPVPAKYENTEQHVFLALFIVQLGWIAIVAANLMIDRYVGRLDLKASDNLLARKAATQMRIFRQAVGVLLVLLTLAFALMSFDSVRQFGISLFASAGIAGIVAGLAARPMLENLIAGVQLALTQPLRLEDAVVINNEWGWVEEINSTYIVVRLWDWRRQVVPLSYLFQNPFTNWTRASSSIIGTVFVYADYTLPMTAVRTAATDIVQASRLWDGQVVNVQVSDAKDHVIEVRVLASASDSSRAWDLRCEIREKLIAFIRDNYPECLPRQRREDFRMAESGRQSFPPH
ncbi:MAG TPA: mechanosensitive ion channel family protein [Rhizomicrobium sp.]|jgi:small-conductance mechanosensitive channel|nr:mechanosensitive ion channel family protein [Rhizomicrobium sp.]